MLQSRVQEGGGDCVHPHEAQPMGHPAGHPVGRRRSVGSVPPATSAPGLASWDVRPAPGTDPSHAGGHISGPGRPASSNASAPGDSLGNIREEDNLDDTQASHGANGSPSTDSGKDTPPKYGTAVIPRGTPSAFACLIVRKEWLAVNYVCVCRFLQQLLLLRCGQPGFRLRT